jgi:hypothetical protein
MGINAELRTLDQRPAAHATWAERETSDYTKRAEPGDILSALRALNSRETP